MRIGIFWLGTSVYKNYFDNFISTFRNLFPNDEKILVVLSDGFEELDGKQYEDGSKIISKKIIDYPYPLVTANKVQMVKTYMEELNLSYAMYVDADTICFQKPNEFWEDLKIKIQENKLLMTYHPHYLYTPYRNFGEPFIVSNMNSSAYMSPDYVNNNKCYIMTSFFMGSYEVIDKYAKEIYNMLGKDLTKMRWMPIYPDEAYFNKIYVEESINNNTQIELDRYITINPYPFGNFPQYQNGNVWINNFDDQPNIFLNQKYDIELKNKKKENLV